jgi:hypothetical protein
VTVSVTRVTHISRTNCSKCLPGNQWIDEYELEAECEDEGDRSLSMTSASFINAILVYPCFTFDVLITSNGFPSYFLPPEKLHGNTPLL